MTRKLLVLFVLMLTLSSVQAQEEGIHFYKGNWEEAIKLAKKEKKKIFIDFYTEWCGPCLNMALNTFIRQDVGAVYNKNFICLKIDAEKGEGKELAKRYEVRSYPTYVFVDPSSQKIVHRSGGNKPAPDFIADADGALNPKLSSFAIEEKYKSGKYDANFLKAFIKRRKVSGDRDVVKYFDELIGKGAKLTDPEIWTLFCECVTGYNNPYIKQVSENYSTFVDKFGKQAVDKKLKEATAYAPADVLNTFVDFDGKSFNQKMQKMSTTFRNEGNDKGFAYVDELIKDETIDKKEFVRLLSFQVRVSPKYGEDKNSFDEVARKVKYLRYIAYNNYDRDDAFVHYNYANALEYLIQRAAKEGRTIPQDLLTAPEMGKAEYDMRHPLLKQKPRRK